MQYDHSGALCRDLTCLESVMRFLRRPEHSSQKRCVAHAGNGPPVEEADKQRDAFLTETLLPATFAHSHVGSQGSGAVRASPLFGIEALLSRDCHIQTVE